MGKKVDVPDFSNATPTFLIDEIGTTRERIKNLERYEGLCKQAMIARIDPGAVTVQGEKFEVNINTITQVRLDGDKAKEALGDRLAECQKEITYKEYRTKRISGEPE